MLSFIFISFIRTISKIFGLSNIGFYIYFNTNRSSASTLFSINEKVFERTKMNNKINNYLISYYSKILLNTILISFCLGLILNLFEEIEFLKIPMKAYYYH